MKELVIDGKKYQKATEVARHLGYTSDYVGQLCRAGKVEAQQIGRSWYVVPETIHAHKKTRYRSNQAKSKAAIAEYRQATAGQGALTRASAPGTRHIPVHHYESDDADLFPSLGGTVSGQQQARPQPASQPTTTARPEAPPAAPTLVRVKTASKANKFKPAEKQTVTFKGRLTVGTAEENEPIKEKTSTTKKSVSALKGSEIEPHPSFRERVELTSPAMESEPKAVPITHRTRHQKRWSMRRALRWLSGTALVLAAAFLLLSVRTEYQYSEGNLTRSLTINTTHITNYINENIVILFKL